MSIQDAITAFPFQLMSGPALKLVFTITCSGEKNSLVSGVFSVNKLVEVRFKWEYSKISAKNIKIICSFSSRRLKTEKYTSIYVNVRSDTLKCVKTDFCPPECWSDWECMVEITPQTLQLTQSSALVYYTTFDCYITACKLKIDLFSSKLYEDTDFTDFNLKAPEGSVAVHKACLAAHSDVFKKMLNGNWQETTECEIGLEGVTLETLQHLKDYMYLGKLPNDGLRPLLLIARCYMMDSLQERCITKLAQTATSENLYSLHKFACDNNIPELTFATLQLTRDSVVSYAQVKKKRIN